MFSIRVNSLVVLLLLAGCTNPLNFADYEGDATAVFVSNGETYKADWHYTIHRDEIMAMGRNPTAWRLAPSGTLVPLKDGSAVWVEGDYTYLDIQQLGSDSLVQQNGSNILKELENSRHINLPARVYWMDSPQHPSVIKATPWPCDPQFPLQDCRAVVSYHVEENYTGPDKSKREAKRDSIYFTAHNTSAGGGLYWLQDLGVNYRQYASLRMMYCSANSWLGKQLRTKIKKENIPPLQAISTYGAITGGCEQTSNITLPENYWISRKWEFTTSGPHEAIEMNGNNYALKYLGNSTWEIPENHEKMITYYRLESPVPEKDFSQLAPLRMLHGKFGDVSIPKGLTGEAAFLLPNSDDIVVIMPLRPYL